MKNNDTTNCITALVIVILCMAFTPYVFMLLWNWLAPIFWSCAPILTFWQSFGIVILLGIIGSFFRNNNNN